MNNKVRRPAPFAAVYWIPLSLAVPALAVALFHWVNFRSFGPRGPRLLDLTFRFLPNLSELDISIPDGLVGWVFRIAVLMAPVWLLGRAILGRAIHDRWIRTLVAFPVGLGIVGVVLEALAMAGLFSAPVLIGVYVGVLVLAIGLLLKPDYVEIAPEPAIAGCGAPFRWFAWIAFGSMIVLGFEHALFFPPTYHDALIYYLYYSKLIFLNQGIPFPVDASGFPELVQCQVGLGLGANYAHLFLLWQASVCRVFGEWSSFPGQFIPPLAGMATGLLVYATVRFRWRSERLGLWAMLLVQSVPYWIWYQNWVSDYPLAVWLTVSCVALLTVGEPRRIRVLLGLVCLAIAGSHLNYLMVTLWWFPLVSWIAQGNCRWGKKPLMIMVAGLALSSIWFIRNWIVTGNPVYAFFPEIFGGINVDLDVLRSCENEWMKNGDGFGVLGDTLWERISDLHGYFLLYSNLALKWATLPVGWFLLGLIVFLKRFRIDRFRVSVLVYILFLFFYGLVVSGMYLYHIMPLVPLMVLVAADWLSRVDRGPRISGVLHNLLVALVVLTVGIPASLMGAKFVVAPAPHAVRPGMDAQDFLTLSQGDYARMWRLLNERLPQGTTILTHENRHYYLRDDLRFLHLDDYRLIPYYDKSPEEVIARLRELGVDFYLRIPNEDNHPIVKRLGIDGMLGKSFKPLWKLGGGNLAVYAFSHGMGISSSPRGSPRSE